MTFFVDTNAFEVQSCAFGGDTRPSPVTP